MCTRQHFQGRNIDTASICKSCSRQISLGEDPLHPFSRLLHPIAPVHMLVWTYN